MISFVYFDVGGVAIKDFSGSNKWAQMKDDFGIKKEDSARFDEFYKRYQKRVHVGLEIDNVMQPVSKEFGVNFPDDFSWLKYYVDRFEKNNAFIKIVKKLKQECKIGLLTNMYPGMLPEIFKRGLLPKDIWDAIIDSTVENCQKPDREIYELAQQRAKVNNNEILFVDNSLENVKAAENFGWKCFFYNSSNHDKSCADLLTYYNQY